MNALLITILCFLCLCLMATVYPRAKALKWLATLQFLLVVAQTVIYLKGW